VYGDGSWTVSEMNYQGWGIVDRRRIRPGTVPLIGFIY
jgi:surface antigen